MSHNLQGKHVILGVCGGIAAYKSAELLRLIIKQGASVQVIMTANAARFVTPLTFEVLSRRKVCVDLFQDRFSAAVDHIQWAQEADAVVIAPATANMVSKLANGLADDALSTLMLAVTCPVMICPSMNSNMYLSDPVQRNSALLKASEFFVLEPAEGELAEGTTGPGRLPEPAVIVDRLQHMLTPKDFLGRKVLVTAGPTREAIDPVRFISNPSSGKMGYAMARAAEMRGAQVVLISGPTALAAPINVELIRVTTAEEMAKVVLAHLPRTDVVIKTAAVSDFRPKIVHDVKIKKEQAESVIGLERTMDILATVGQRKKDQIVVGFAAETHEMERYARSKLKAKNLDLVVGILVGGNQGAFGNDTNQVTLFYKDGRSERLETMAKDALAHHLLDRLATIK